MRRSLAQRLASLAARLPASSPQPTPPGLLRQLSTGTAGSTAGTTASGWHRAGAWGMSAAAAAAAVCSTNSAACAPLLPGAVDKSTKAAGNGAAPSSAHTKQKVIFVLGGPGSGKGTQCAKLIEEFPDVAHFSAGDLLREHIKSGSKEGNEVAEMIQQGQIVPAEITVGLLKAAMASSGKAKILIDGFPRNASNRETFMQMVGYDCEFVLFFDCPESVLEARILGRNQGRTDDNLETIKKRFHVFMSQSMPVVEEYEKCSKVARINTDRPVDVIYKEVRRLVMEV